MSKYKRILFKVSGESLMGNKAFGHDVDAINELCDQIKKLHEKKVQVCLVVGGGNLFRGVSVSAEIMNRANADYMGMLATVINGMALQNALELHGVETRMQSAIKMNTICEPYIKRRADRHLEKNRVVIFAGGTGNPFFTTDTAAVLRAVEMDCDVLLKGTQVDGVYSADPKKDKKAKRYDKLTYKEVIVQDLKVMDSTAFTLARDNKLPIVVFPIKGKNSLVDAVSGKGKFTVIE